MHNFSGKKIHIFNKKVKKQNVCYLKSSKIILDVMVTTPVQVVLVDS